MTVWILIIGFHTAGITSAEFASEQACRAAAEATRLAVIESGPVVNAGRFFFWTCNPKGTPE